MMWYQYGPFVAYLRVGRNDDVVALADAVSQDAASLEEPHYYKGVALSALGLTTQARNEFQVVLNEKPNYFDARLALQQLPAIP